MSQHLSPKIVSNGLVFCGDAANTKSFRGIGGTNLLTGISYGYNNTDTSTFKYQRGLENVYIPALGSRLATACYIYNDYNGGSGQCCPFILYHGGGFVVSPNTTYTYATIYKTLTGYTNANYMYRYEYTTGGSYVTEGGVHSNSNRVSLGDGWWYAWGQFTTAATTGQISSVPMAHYEYATNNTVYVVASSITQGTYVHDPRYLVPFGTARLDTVAGGGGLIDISRSGNDASLINGPTFNSTNGGSISFDGSNDYVNVNSSANVLSTTAYTKMAFIYPTSLLTSNNIISGGNSGQHAFWLGGGNKFQAGHNGNWSTVVSTSTITANNWYFGAVTFSSANGWKLYFNGTLEASSISTTTFTGTGFIRIGAYDTGNNFTGNIACPIVYNRELTATEIAQNFNALRGRFGI